MISEFRGEYRWLSNFQEVDIYYDGMYYPTTEHAYQASKTLNLRVRRMIANAPTPGQARKLGQTIEMRPDWCNVRLKVMEDITRLKFKNSDLKEKLLATEDQELVEGNTWGDMFWGVCEGKGENHLGKILMKIRTELKKG
jgi:ribA/ribD-fused uncharacterized protein